MGVLNVTPDSFSDGGRYANRDAAVAHGIAMCADGAALIDVGGESTRPGAGRVDAEEESRRVLPVIRDLAAAGVRVSIDTTRASVAAAAIEAGAVTVNDVSGGLADPQMAKVVAAAGVPWILMHWRGHSQRMQQLAVYDDVVAEVRDELSRRVDEALAAGVAAENVIIDPGLGFAKTAAHNWALTRHLGTLLSLGFPLLFAASRKSYLGSLLAGPDGTPRPAGEQRDAATVATSVLAVAAGAWGVRVHQVRDTADAIAVWQAAGAPRAVWPATGTAIPATDAANRATDAANPATDAADRATDAAGQATDAADQATGAADSVTEAKPAAGAAKPASGTAAGTPGVEGA
nr:dihydropteroate synthase [Catenuloplanes indicus]